MLAELVGLLSKAQPAPPFSVVSVAVPGKWVFFVAPEHPAYPDVLALWLSEFDVKALRDLQAVTPADDDRAHLLREYIKAELARRGKR